jgi:hypothetical protein
MVRVKQVILDPAAKEWLMALVALSKAQRGESLGDYCQACGLNYRHLYGVINGDSCISYEKLCALKERAFTLRIGPVIESQILATRIGVRTTEPTQPTP